MNQTPPKLIFLVVLTIGTLALTGVTSLCISLFYKTYADPAILTAIITITSGLVGSLTTILANPRTQPASSESTTTITTSVKPSNGNGNGTAKVEVVQPKDKPVPVQPVGGK